ncbi:MAG: hypothetical protein WCX30_03115 [Candidatus Paceibacterota bacterium]
MEEKCFLCGKEVLKEKYYFSFNRIAYEIFPGFNDVFTFCNVCNQKRIEASLDNYRVQKIEVEKIIKAEGNILQISWMEFFLLKRMLRGSHRSEIWNLYSDLIDILICLGFVTLQPVEHWMFDGNYNLAHYLGRRLYFITKKSAIDFCNAEIGTEPLNVKYFPRTLMQIKDVEVYEMRFN